MSDSPPAPTETLTLTPSPTPIPKIPLILIPGIAGSELKITDPLVWYEDDGHGGKFFNNYGSNEKVWVNNFQAVLPGEDDYFDVLRMSNDGQTSQANLALTGTLFDGYSETINFFTASGYTLNQDFFVFPYDWRKDIALTVPLLDEKINAVKLQTGNPKVDIVAHSMGGLVARNYISDFSKAQNVRKLFTLGTPYLGAVDFLKNLRFGGCLMYEFGPFCLSIARSEVKDILQNLISGYEFAPSQEYFNFYNGQDKNHLYPYQYNGQPFNYDRIKFFLTGLNYNTGLFGPSELFHVLDSSLTNTNGVEVINIAGSGLPTLGQIREKSVRNFSGNNVQKKDGFSTNGDKTVPLFSASLIDYSNNRSLLGDAMVFYVRQEHGELVASGSALNLVENILKGNSYIPDGVNFFPYTFSGTQISVHSPVNINAYDSLGNHTGPTNDGDFEANIPGSSYDTMDDAKFIFLPNDGNYDIRLAAIGQGSFDFKIRQYENNELTRETLYKDIPLVLLTKAEAQLNTSSNISPIIYLDENGDGIIDRNINPSSSLTGDVAYDGIPPETNFQIYGELGNNGWFRSDAIVTLIPQDDESGSGILKTEYSLDNGQSVNIYTEPFVISEEKINKLKFRSVDNAGNEEDPKEAEIKIDQTPPQIAIDVNPKTLWPANNKMINVKITGNSSDVNLLNTKITVDDEYHKIEPLISGFGQTIQLQASRNGNDPDGRKYTIRATAEDLAGNTAQALADVTVPHDQR